MTQRGQVVEPRPGRSRRKAELVALDTGQDRPGVAPLILVIQMGCTELDQPDDLGRPVVGDKVEVHAVLGDPTVTAVAFVEGALADE